MKSKTFISFFLLVICLLCLITNINTRNPTKKDKVRTPHDYPYYRFYYGVLSKLIGPNQKNMDLCFPTTWLNKKISKDDQINIKDSLTAIQSTLSRISVSLNKKIDKACKDKSYIVDYLLTKNLINAHPVTRRMMFLEKRHKSYKRHKKHVHFIRNKLRPFNWFDFKSIKNTLTGFIELPLMKELDNVIK